MPRSGRGARDVYGGPQPFSASQESAAVDAETGSSAANGPVGGTSGADFGGRLRSRFPRTGFAVGTIAPSIGPVFPGRCLSLVGRFIAEAKPFGPDPAIDLP
jgi:hypothetical protein